MAEIVKKQDKLQTVRQLLERMRPQMELALPKHLTGERMARVALTACIQNSDLLECTQASLAGAFMVCSQLGLEPVGAGGAWLVPFRNKGILTVTVIPDYRGLLDLIRRSGLISSFQARVVYEGDHFLREYGLQEKLEHRPTDTPKVDEHGHPIPSAFYFIAKMKDGGVQWNAMTRLEVERHRDRFSRAAKTGPWVTDFGPMGLKTVIRQGSKLLPQSAEYRLAVDLDEKAELGLTQEIEQFAPPDVVDAKPSTIDQVSEALRQSQDAGPTTSGIAPEMSPPSVIQPAPPMPAPAPTEAASVAPLSPAPAVAVPAAPAPASAPVDVGPTAPATETLGDIARSEAIGRIETLMVKLKLNPGQTAYLWQRYVKGPRDKAPKAEFDALQAELEGIIARRKNKR